MCGRGAEVVERSSLKRDKIMTSSYSGGCQCGAVRYTLSQEPERLYTCHCTECQTQSGSAFGMTMLVKEEGITVTGTLKEFSRTSDKGNLVKAYFCPECGVRIYGKPGYVKGVVSLKPGTLDDTSWLNPDTALWVKSSQNWFELPEHTDKIEEQ